MTGWGLINTTDQPPHNLRQAVVQIQPADTPNLFGCYLITSFDKKKQLCAGYPAYDHHGRRGTCFGDSGSPLVKRNKHIHNRWFQYGVASGASKPCGVDSPLAGKLAFFWHLMNNVE